MALAFGIVPHIDDEATRAALGKLCTYLTKEVGVEVKPFVASTPVALALAFGDRTIQLAWVSPTLMLEASLEGVIPLLSTGREGLHAYHSIVAVPQSSAIRKPEELAGRTMAWVARTSAAGYIVPRLSLARRGIKVRKLFGREVFLTSHAAVARAVAERRADAGATYAVFADGNPAHSIIRSGFRDFAPEVPVRILDIGGPIPADVICSHASVPAADRERIATAFMRSPKDPVAGPLVRHVIGADQFRAFSDESMTALKQLMEDVHRYGL